MHRNQHPDESGQSLIELALSLPIFVLIVLATAEIANVAWWSIQVNNAAHAGAQFGSLSHANASNTNNDIETAAQNDVPASLVLTFPTAPSQACACVDTSGNATTMACSTITTTTCQSPSIIQDTLTVTVQAQVTPLIHYWGLPSTYTLNATATTPVINQ